ncbi:caspase family protein [Tychonema sp. BBK16]|uniref:nSTAND1 domain-containing NTPase n=1 Tax=Tychonema sp. BBK16 TaxID=2699888 RepID=UPI001F177C83|nr:caspase family protein [Tychonema sp. BBK16]MCF6372257.1 caspase family protein [Tychonema sp. BBK16]
MARYALVIGITEYQSSQMSRLPKAASDAEILAQVLEQYGGFEVKRLPARWNAEKSCFEISADKAVTAAEVGKELRTLLLDRATKNEALIYFAGHGFTFSDTLGQQKGVLATSDCQVEMAGKEVIDYKYGISLASLNDLIQQSDLSSLVMLLDCCHSGYFLESQLVQRALTAFSTQRDYYLMAACRTFETAKSLKGEPNSYFTGAVLKGLASENAGRNRRVSGDRLFDYISGELKSFVQEPIRMGWGRSITLVTYPQSEMPATEISFDRKNPYLGLSAFEAEQEKYFCGREEAVKILITHLTNSRFIPVIGYSGSGKSSLIKAGLSPQLSRDRIPGSSHWPVESFTPGKHPLGKLVDILARYRDQNQPFVIFIDQFEEVFTLCEDESERGSFIRLIAEEMNDSARNSRMIIAIRGDFLIRCTNYPDVLNLINHIPPSTYIVKSLGMEELPEAIEQPALLHGVKFERGLVSQIAQDVAGQPGALPLLQYALKELWRVCIEKPELPEPLLTRKGYEDIGGVQGALENRANAIYQSLSDGDRLFVRKLFMELVQLGEGSEVTRRRVDWDRLSAIADSTEQLDRVIGLLAGAQQRLIIVDENTVEVAHEALLCRWKLVSGWIEEDRENIRISRRLETACREWKESYGKSDDALLTGARLAEVEEWERRVQRNLTGDEREFLVKSVGRRDRQIQDELEQQRQLRELAEAKAKAEAEKAEEERAKTIAQMERAIAAEDKVNAEAARAREAEARVRVQKQRTRLAIASGILLTFTLGLGLVSNVLVGQKREQEASKVGLLIGKAQQLLESNLQLEALIASVEALKEIKKLGRENAEQLQKIHSVIYNVQEQNRLEEHKGKVNTVSFSPDGTTIATAGSDKNIILWNPKGKIMHSLNKAHEKSIWRIRYSRDSQLFASPSSDKTVKIWNQKREVLHTLKFGDKDQSVYDVSFNMYNQKIAACGASRSIKIWDVQKGILLKSLIDKDSEVKKVYATYGLDYSPINPSILVSTGFKDYDLNVWNLNDKEENKPKHIGNNEYAVSSVRFNKGGNQIVSGDYKGIIKLWEIKGSNVTLIGQIKGHEDPILHVVFSPDSKLIASASEDRSIKIWSVNQALKNRGINSGHLDKPLEVLQGHRGQVSHISFHPKNSKLLASASDDGTVRIWTLLKSKISPTEDSSNQLDALLYTSCNFLENYLQSSKKCSQENCHICR